MAEFDVFAIVIVAVVDVWALAMTGLALHRSRRVADESVDEISKSLTLLARDWAERRRAGGTPESASI